MVVILLDKMDVLFFGIYMSVMIFSIEVEFFILFNGYNDVDDLKRKIIVLFYYIGWLCIDFGLIVVKEWMFDYDVGVRDVKWVLRVFVVFINGKIDGKICKLFWNV